tara:strand:+ start:14340 stop:14771 length:432 start_codon:yes stop_codon:yes gene_type:complete
VKKKSLFIILILSFIQVHASEYEHSEVHDLMAYILDPAAEVIWDSAGFIITEEGETNLAPTNQEEWDRVKHAAKVISGSSYLLSRPEVVADKTQWVSLSIALKGVGEKLFEAAENKDSESLFKTGAELYQVCVACHQVYWIKD